MYITITKVYRDRLSFNQATSRPVTDTFENRAARNGTYHTRIARRADRVYLWSNSEYHMSLMKGD